MSEIDGFMEILNILNEDDLKHQTYYHYKMICTADIDEGYSFEFEPLPPLHTQDAVKQEQYPMKLNAYLNKEKYCLVLHFENLDSFQEIYEENFSRLKIFEVKKASRKKSFLDDSDYELTKLTLKEIIDKMYLSKKSAFSDSNLYPLSYIGYDIVPRIYVGD